MKYLLLLLPIFCEAQCYERSTSIALLHHAGSTGMEFSRTHKRDDGLSGSLGIELIKGEKVYLPVFARLAYGNTFQPYWMAGYSFIHAGAFNEFGASLKAGAVTVGAGYRLLNFYKISNEENHNADGFCLRIGVTLK